jgi:hypothetical protein
MITLPWLTVAFAAVLVTLLVRAIALGYPAATLPAGSALSRKEQAIAAACADALFPPGGPIPVSGTEAGLVAYMNTYIARLPPSPRTLARLLFHFVEHGPWIFGPRLARFTRLSAEERILALREMSESSIYFRRVAFISLRAMMTMGYLAHPAVAEAMHMVADPAPFERRPSVRPSSVGQEAIA